ncbi:MAG: type I-B CRISPR-associated protein Cas7/Cst2/DevR [Bacteroidota bacterium]
MTFLAKVSFGSLNGGDKEVDNINPIKKITLANGQQLPYMSAQALRRALRDRLEEMGETISVVTKGDGKAPSTTASDPEQYIDDDLFGYMDAKGGKQRTSPVRVDALVALNPYQGDLDFGTNYQAKDQGGDPNIFESEIHSGIYRGTILIELDRIGKGRISDGKTYDENDFVDNATKVLRTHKLIDAIQTLWSSGRQSRFLSDISPKFIAAAWMSAKNPIFLEAVNHKDGQTNIAALQDVATDYADFIEDHVFAIQAGTLGDEAGTVGLKEGFAKIKSWVSKYYES